MAVTAAPRRRSGRVWAVLACVFGLMISCSGTPQTPPVESAAEAVTSSQPPAPTVTLYRIESEARWSVGADPAPAAPDDQLRYLAPTAPIDGLDTEAKFWRADAGGVPEYTVVARSPTGKMAVSARLAECRTTPDGAEWQPVEIRGVEGCEWTNGAGLYFLKWTEGTTNYHYESFSITGQQARDLLADWRPLQ